MIDILCSLQVCNSISFKCFAVRSQEFKKNDSRAMMSDLVWNKSVSDPH